MKRFRVFLRGENFLLSVEGTAKRLGFYTTRFLEAPDERAAEQQAVESLRQNEELRSGVLNDPSDPPMLFAEEIEEIPSFEGMEDRDLGLAFFDDESS